MAFCSKCGSELSPGTKFCGGCGTPADFVASSGAVAGQLPAGAVPVANSTSGGSLRLVLIIVAVIGCLGVLSVAAVTFGLWRISKSVNVDRSGGVSISTPSGKIYAGKISSGTTESEVGVPIYPGATPAEGGFKVGGESGSMATYVFTTSDSPKRVLAFYRDRFGPKSSVVESPQGAMVTASTSDNEGIIVTISRDENEDKTSITVTRTVSTKR